MKALCTVSRGAARACASVLAASSLAGCGGVTSPDLFVVSRSGKIAQARLELLVNDGGTVRCNGGPPRMLPADLLLEARDLVRVLAPDAKRGLTLASTGNAVLTYRLRDDDGHISFPDTAASSRPVLGRVAYFTRRAAQSACGLTR